MQSNAYTHALPRPQKQQQLRHNTAATHMNDLFLYCTGVSVTTENEINAFRILNHTFRMAGPHCSKTGKKLNCEIWFTDVADQNEHGLIWLQYRSTSKLVHIPEITPPLLPSFRHAYHSL